MLIVAAFECRSDTASLLTLSTFDSKRMNWVALAEFLVAVATTQIDGFRRLLDTTDLNLEQWAWALVPAAALLVLWEIGKLVSRRVATPDSADAADDSGPRAQARASVTAPITDP